MVTDAEATLLAILEQVGLGDLKDLALREIRASGGQIDENRLMFNIRQSDSYKRRFAGMEVRRREGRIAIDEREYLALERSYENIMRNAGLPTGFYDSPDDFANLIGMDVSAGELEQRVISGYQAVRTANPEVRQSLERLYGVTEGELAAYFLDPDRAVPVIERQVTTARIGAAAARQGFDMGRVALERISELGISAEEGQQIFDTLGQGRELLQSLAPTEEALSAEETAVSLAGGGSPEAARRLRQRQRERVAQFEGGGQFAAAGGQTIGLQTA